MRQGPSDRDYSPERCDRGKEKLDRVRICMTPFSSSSSPSLLFHCITRIADLAPRRDSFPQVTHRSTHIELEIVPLRDASVKHDNATYEDRKK